MKQTITYKWIKPYRGPFNKKEAIALSNDLANINQITKIRRRPNTNKKFDIFIKVIN